MKTIFRILIILIVGVLVSGALYLASENTSIASSVNSAPNFDQIPATSAGESAQLPARPDGDFNRNSASLSRGLSEAAVSLAKLTGITLLVLLVQKVFEGVKRRRGVKPILG